MSFSCLTDTIEYDRRRSGLSREGALSAVYSATEKISFALGSVFFGFILAAAGFLESTGEEVVQPDSALWGITIGFVIMPALLHLISLLILRKYTLTNETLKGVTLRRSANGGSRANVSRKQEVGTIEVRTPRDEISIT